MSGAEYPVKRGASPWDTIEHAYEIAPGIVRVSTPSHGGIWLSAQRIAQLPKWALAVNSGYAPKPVWWEEDCEVVVPLYVFRKEAVETCGYLPTFEEVVAHMSSYYGMLDAIAQDPTLAHEPAMARVRELCARPRHPRQLVGGAS